MSLESDARAKALADHYTKCGYIVDEIHGETMKRHAAVGEIIKDILGDGSNKTQSLKSIPREQLERLIAARVVFRDSREFRVFQSMEEIPLDADLLARVARDDAEGIAVIGFEVTSQAAKEGERRANRGHGRGWALGT